jgi:hypothetical protein
MHYANGREAKFGDLVKGRGYNLKHEFTGVVCNLRPDSKDSEGKGTCNISIATVTKTAILPDRCLPGYRRCALDR